MTKHGHEHGHKPHHKSDPAVDPELDPVADPPVDPDPLADPEPAPDPAPEPTPAPEPPPIDKMEAVRSNRYQTLAALITGKPSKSDFPSTLAGEVEPLVDAIKYGGVPAMGDVFGWQSFYRRVYKLICEFMSRAPGKSDEVGNDRLAKLDEVIGHVAQMAELCKYYARQADAKNAVTHGERMAALGDVTNSSHVGVLEMAGMTAADFLPIAELVRKYAADLRTLAEPPKPETPESPVVAEAAAE
jgi:hypothetical protein